MLLQRKSSQNSQGKVTGRLRALGRKDRLSRFHKRLLEAARRSSLGTGCCSPVFQGPCTLLCSSWCWQWENRLAGHMAWSNLAIWECLLDIFLLVKVLFSISIWLWLTFGVPPLSLQVTELLHTNPPQWKWPLRKMRKELLRCAQKCCRNKATAQACLK